MKQGNGIWLKDTIQLLSYLKERLIVGLIIGIITLVLTIVFKKFYWEYAPDLNTAVLVTVIIFLFYIAKDSYKIFELRNRLEKADLVYKDLLDGHCCLPSGYSSFMDSMILDTNFKTGIAMININDGKYKMLLETCSKNLKESYCASFTYPYTIKRIFDPSNDGIKINDVIEFMKTMNNNIAPHIIKKRIFIFDKEKFYSELEAVTDEYNFKLFFLEQKNFKLYFIDKSAIQQNATLHFKFSSVLNADFALFDDSLTFRRIDKEELAYYFVNNSCVTLPGHFKDIFCSSTFRYDDGIFYPLEETLKTINRPAFNKQDIMKSIKEDLKIN
jgi:hypothetical protein